MCDYLTATLLAGCAEQHEGQQAVYPKQPRASTGGAIDGRVQLPDRGALSFTRETVARRGHCSYTILGTGPQTRPDSHWCARARRATWSPFRCEFDTSGTHHSMMWRPRSGRYVSPLGTGWAGATAETCASDSLTIKCRSPGWVGLHDWLNDVASVTREPRISSSI